MAVASQEHTKIVEPSDDSLQLHAIDEEDGERNLVFAHIVEKRILQVLSAFCRHDFFPFFS